MSNNGFVSLGDNTVPVAAQGNGEQKKANIFKGEAGKTYRIYFPTDQVCQRKRHWHAEEPRGYYRCTQDTDGYCPVCVKASSDNTIRKASTSFGANIVVYDTDAQGNALNPSSPTAKVAFWSFSSDKFTMIRNIINQWGNLTDMDLLVTCTDQQFQKMLIQPAKGCWYHDFPELKSQVDVSLQNDSVPLDKFLCKDVPMLQLAQVFGIPRNAIPQPIVEQQLALHGEPQVQGQTQTAPPMQPNAPQYAQPGQYAQVPPPAAPSYQPQGMPAAAAAPSAPLQYTPQQAPAVPVQQAPLQQAPPVMQAQAPQADIPVQTVPVQTSSDDMSNYASLDELSAILEG